MLMVVIGGLIGFAVLLCWPLLEERVGAIMGRLRPPPPPPKPVVTDVIKLGPRPYDARDYILEHHRAPGPGEPGFMERVAPASAPPPPSAAPPPGAQAAGPGPANPAA